MALLSLNAGGAVSGVSELAAAAVAAATAAAAAAAAAVTAATTAAAAGCGPRWRCLQGR